MDLTVTLAHRTALRRLRDGATMIELCASSLGHLLPELVDAGLVVAHHGDGAPVYTLSGVGREYMRIMDEPTRRIERPGPRPVPVPWRLLDASTAEHPSGHTLELPCERGELEEAYRFARDTAELYHWILESFGQEEGA